MSIYLVKKQEIDCVEPFIQDEIISSFLEENIGIQSIGNWKTIETKWNRENGELICDFPFLLGTIPLCNVEIYHKLQEKLNLEGIEFLPIRIENELYYIMNPCLSIKGILNKKQSKIDYFSNGDIMWISKYVFYPNEIETSMFKIPEMYTSIFATTSFVEFIRENHFTGIEFEPCAIKKESFLSRIFK